MRPDSAGTKSGALKVQGTSDDEGEDEEEECIAAKRARDPGAPTAEISKRAVSYWPPPSLVPAEADSTKQTSSDRDHTSVERRQLLHRRRDGSPRITGAGDG